MPACVGTHHRAETRLFFTWEGARGLLVFTKFKSKPWTKTSGFQDSLDGCARPSEEVSGTAWKAVKPLGFAGFQAAHLPSLSSSGTGKKLGTSFLPTSEEPVGGRWTKPSQAVLASSETPKGHRHSEPLKQPTGAASCWAVAEEGGGKLRNSAWGLLL